MALSEKDWDSFFWTPVILLITGTFQFFKGNHQTAFIFFAIGVAILVPLLIRKYRK